MDKDATEGSGGREEEGGGSYSGGSVGLFGGASGELKPLRRYGERRGEIGGYFRKRFRDVVA